MIEDDLRAIAAECTTLAESSLKAIKDLEIRKRAWGTMEQAAADMRERAAAAVHDLMPSWFRDGTMGRADVERVIRRLPLSIAPATRNRPDPALQTTLRPREYLGSEEYPEGIYSGHDLRLADMTPNAAVGSPCGVMSIIWSVGATPEDAIRALCAERLGEFGEDMEPLGEGGAPGFTWGFRFTADGTGCKAAGIHVPGGVILTWWK